MTSATANSCAPATSIGTVSAPGTNSTAVSSPTVFNAPRPPPRDDGRLIALASLIGGFMDAILGGDALGEALAAENQWKSILDNVMYPRGQQELNRVDAERAKLPYFEDDLKQTLTDYRAKADLLWPKLAPLETKVNARIALSHTRADAQYGELAALDQQVHDAITTMSTLANEAKADAELLCVDDAFDRLCQFAACGYVPDYEGVAERARADAELAAKTAYADACRMSNRYNVRNGLNAAFDTRMGTVQAAIAGTSKAREMERQFAFKANEEIRFKHADLVERVRMGRMDYSLRASGRQQELAVKHWDLHAQLFDRLDARSLEALRARWVDISKLYMDVEGRGDGLAETQWRMFAESAFKSLREGGEMLAAAAQAYQFLAASIRATAKQGGGGSGGITGALVSLAAIYPMFSGSCKPVTLLGIPLYSRPQDCGCPATPAAT